MVLFSIGIWRIQFCGTWKIVFFYTKVWQRKHIILIFSNHVAHKKFYLEYFLKPEFNFKNGYEPLSYSTGKPGHLNLWLPLS